MNDKRRGIELATEIARLYEMTLAIGRSPNLEEMCLAFCRTVAQVYNLSSISVWVRGDRLGRCDNCYVRALALPDAGAGPDSLPATHPATLAAHAGKAVSLAIEGPDGSQLITEDGVTRGIVTLFPLGQVGFLKMVGIGQHEPFRSREVNQLGHVMEKFTSAVEGCLNHRDLQLAKAEKEESEERLELALAGADMGSWVWDMTAHDTRFDTRWFALLGYTPDELPPGLLAWEDRIHPDDRTMVVEAMLRHVEGLTPTYETEHRLRHRHGHWVWVLDRGRVVRWDEQDRPLRAAGTTLDVTRRHDAAIRSHRLQNLREITSDVLNSFLKTEDLSVAIDMILNRVGTAFGVSRSYLFRYRNDLIWMSNTHEWCAHGVEPQIDNLQQLPASEFPWWNRELESGRTINIANLAEADLDEATRDVLESQDIKALLVLPVMINGKLEGFFGFDETSQPRAWHDEETALLSVMVEAYSRAVERTIARRVQSGTTRLLAEALERAEEASQAQASFLARMSHEIRTPLSGITGLGRALARTELDDGQREFLRALLSSANSLRDIIGDILDFSKISERKLQLQTQAVNPVDLLEDVAQTYAASARAKGLTLYCDLAPTLPVSIMVDPVHLRQVVGNLLSNAVKFTPDGAISLEAGVARMGEDGIHLEIRVTDTGIGIDAETLPRIFEPFVQADHSTRRRFEGTGLGLAIVRQLIELMGGAIDVTSEPGRGSVFCCRLPITPALMPVLAPTPARQQSNCLQVTGDDPRHVAIVQRQVASRRLCEDGAAPQSCGIVCVLASNMPIQLEVSNGALRIIDARRRGIDAVELPLPVRTENLLAHLQRVSRRDTTIPETTMPSALPMDGSAGGDACCLAGKRVLVIEDNEVNRVVLGEMLRHWRCRYVLAPDGEAALAAYARETFDVILSDIELPGLDGCDIAREIRRRERGTGTNTPIIALTAHATTQVRQSCRAAGMDAFLSKSEDEQAMRDTICRLLHCEAPVEPVVETRPLDAEQLRVATRGQSDLARQLIGTFVSDAHRQVENMAASFATGDREQARRAAHRIKGSALTVGALRVADLARRLESASAETPAAELLPELENITRILTEDVASLRRGIDNWSPALPADPARGSHP
jgi:PAS domain S-box-containing protein